MSIGVFVLLVVGDMYQFLSGQRLGQSLVSAGRQVVQASLQTLQNRANQDGPPEEGGEGSNQSSRSAVKPASTEYLVINWLESSFAWFQVVILWHDPLLSLCTLTGLLTSLLLLTYLAPRFYATIMIALFIYNLTKVWFRHVWPEIRVPPEDEEIQRADVDRWTYLHPQVLTLKEFGQVTRNLRLLIEFYLKKMTLLRQERPIAFCLATCSILSCTAYLGNRVHGLTLVFSTMILLVVAPGVYLHLLPKGAKKYLWQTIGLKIINDINQSRRQQGETPIEAATIALESDGENEDDYLSKQQSASSDVATTIVDHHSTSASSTVSKSLFDKLKERSLSLYRRSSISSEKVSDVEEEEQEPLLCTEKRSAPIDLHREPSAREEKSEDTSSNDESQSLIDLEEEDQQHDGFVLLG